ncbi:hypothetical protein SDC9_173625 [bioreactor metagenome]|uniref:Uncharacterized protein n=1 Tax=bioreactor metagenome TaxID=1076179 RepID=A0A645GGW2_9ZZZZ
MCVNQYTIRMLPSASNYFLHVGGGRISQSGMSGQIHIDINWHLPLEEASQFCNFLLNQSGILKIPSLRFCTVWEQYPIDQRCIFLYKISRYLPIIGTRNKLK